METNNHISTILDLFPNLTIKQVTDCLKTCNDNIEQTINYLVENIDIVTSITTTERGGNNIKSTDDLIKNSTTTSSSSSSYKTEEEIENERLFKEFMENESKQSEIKNNEKRHLCMVCYCDLPITDFYILDECNHKYCNDCLNAHYTMQVRGGYSNLKCPFPTCKYYPTYQEIQHILSKQYFEKYDKTLVTVHLNNEKNLRYCPEVDCGAPIILPPNFDKTVSPTIECSNQECLSSYCLNCREESHKGLTCKEFETLKAELSQLLEIKENERGLRRTEYLLFSENVNPHKPLSKKTRNRLFLMAKKWARGVDLKILELKLSAPTLKWVVQNTKQCPACNIIIEKIDGCNSMECVCGTNFCYGCGNKRSDHSHIRFPC
ncbi:hypothetical protein RB653_000654 [Dictyostelium firmibasis]|uniref:RBR-type E3 ubiquitin transferase n=1 Tax=Dictyostelium firmibasis TaxID=79012 RepID=A0AAN7U2N3_9MYCE